MNKIYEGYYIVSCDKASVFAGNIKERDGREVTMSNARRIYYWSGAATLSQMAVDGVKNPEECKFAIPLDEIMLLDAIEIIPCTEKSESSIKGVPIWSV
jgi:hypothetical protein